MLPCLEARKKLLQIVADCSKRDWDGYGANPVFPESVIDAIASLDHLPPNSMEPDAVPEPDGTVALEWNRHKDVVVIGFRGSGMIEVSGHVCGKEINEIGKMTNASLPEYAFHLLYLYFTNYEKQKTQA